ncbi:multicopper oxidase [Colletotrichum zoysiae]|uniref:Multicopper oxidase n=1 Tax=Colletotrichum zoysiae TaxID=1216348 RepID=A0AAD9HIT7_9PEZI|nr:multicopper oxidase [Colletotrichum zoysiae]
MVALQKAKTLGCWLLSTQASLSQDKTNGKSPLGTVGAPKLPPFLTNNPLPQGVPWGPLTVDGTNPYSTWPNTGVTRNYDFTISRGTIAPDGYERSVLLVNGAFPGPTIEANWGDWIEVKVTNNITTGTPEGTALHWHGFLQQGTQFEDGVPAISMCPIAPGKTYTYRFQATLYGTTWYHSHYSSQYAGGLVGPMVIYGPGKLSADIDLGPVMLSDWYHKQYYDLLEDILKVGASGLVFSVNNLINGKGNFKCSDVDAGDNTKCTNNAGVSKFKFQTGKTHRLRLINAGAEGTQRFSIDDHTLTVIANDFVPVEPYDTKVVTLGVGQRTDILVKATGNANSAYWMRSNISSCSLTNQPFGLAAIYYDKADETKAPTSKAWDVADPGTCVNDDLSLTKPVFKMTPANIPVTRNLEIKLFRNDSGIIQWSLGGEDFRGDYNSPTLLQAIKGNLTFDANWNVDNYSNNGSIRVVISNNSPAAHPMHLHGFNMYVLAEGPGLTWDGTITDAQNPQRRDVQLVRANGHMVLQIDTADNPGVWPFHCHIAWHASAGLFAQFLVQPDKVKQIKLPQANLDTCTEWQAWTQKNIADQIDSGL